MESGELQVFIVGPARSGTSATYYAMKEVFGLPGPGESHALPIFQRVIHEFYKGVTELADSGVLAQKLVVRDFRMYTYDYVRRFYKQCFPEGSWVDKTPGAEAILGAALIPQIFPKAKIIVTRRTGIEVVQSYRGKFAAEFPEACQAWARCIEALIRLRATNTAMLEVDQFDLANDARGAAKRIAEYLERPDKANALAEFFSNHRGDQQSTHDWKNRLVLANSGWSASEKDAFLTTCGQMMTNLGYPV